MSAATASDSQQIDKEAQPTGSVNRGGWSDREEEKEEKGKMKCEARLTEEGLDLLK